MTTVLLVDDEPDLLAIFGMLLELSGYEVQTAADGEEAMHRMAERRPDILITDWMMPRMGGEELCRELRRPGSPHADVPIIVASAVKQPRRDASPPLYDRFVRKPTSVDDVIRLIEEMEAERGARR